MVVEVMMMEVRFGFWVGLNNENHGRNKRLRDCDFTMWILAYGGKNGAVGWADNTMGSKKGCKREGES